MRGNKIDIVKSLEIGDSASVGWIWKFEIMDKTENLNRINQEEVGTRKKSKSLKKRKRSEVEEIYVSMYLWVLVSEEGK